MHVFYSDTYILHPSNFDYVAQTDLEVSETMYQ